MFFAVHEELGSTVSLPSRIAIRGEGLSILCGDRLFGYDLLNIPEVIHVRLNNLMFSKAQHSIRAGITKQSEYLHIEDCLFYDTGKTAISIKNKNKLSDNNLQFSLLHCVFNGTGGIVSDAKLNECELNWFANNFWMDDQAFFTLNGGTLILKPGFCVPYVSKGIKRRNRITGESKIWNIGSNPRWIDNNNGKVYSFDTRFGGEGKGYCNVYNRGEKGIVYIEGGNTRFLNRYTKHCILYLEQQPEIACLVGMTGYPVRRVLGREQHVWLSETPKKTSVHICGVMVPSPH